MLAALLWLMRCWAATRCSYPGTALAQSGEQRQGRLPWRAGDVEADFWLSMDLLRSGKDNAEFSLVRDWIRNALQVTDAWVMCS